MIILVKSFGENIGVEASPGSWFTRRPKLYMKVTRFHTALHDNLVRALWEQCRSLFEHYWAWNQVVKKRSKFGGGFFTIFPLVLLLRHHLPTWYKLSMNNIEHRIFHITQHLRPPPPPYPMAPICCISTSFGFTTWWLECLCKSKMKTLSEYLVGLLEYVD